MITIISSSPLKKVKSYENVFMFTKKQYEHLKILADITDSVSTINKISWGSDIRGFIYRNRYKISKEEVNIFMSISHDWNKIHYDKAAAEASPIGLIALPGMLTGSLIFYAVESIFDNANNVYYKEQSFNFLKPMIAETYYTIQISELRRNQQNIWLEIEVFDDRKVIAILGKALVSKSPGGHIVGASYPTIMAGFVFSRILGTRFPGHGTVYRQQSILFNDDILFQNKYIAKLNILKEKTIKSNHLIKLKTEIYGENDNSPVVFGTAEIVRNEIPSD